MTPIRILFVACVLAAPGALAQAPFPSRPVTLTVGFAPGGSTDLAARIVAKKLTENLGQPVVVENRAGAGGNIAAQQIAAAAPNGYTISLASVGPLTVSPALYKDLRYDTKRDIAPITMGMVFPDIFVVNPGVPAKTLGELVALAKAKPGELTYASPGVGGAAHLAGELFKQAAGIEMIHVPYKGGGPAITDLLGGRVTMFPSGPGPAQAYVESGRLRALAVTGPTRISTMPDVPTVAESGYPGFEAMNWYAFVAPAKTPGEILDFWNRELVKVLKDPLVKAELAKHGLEPQPSTREELAAYIERETAKWARVVHEAKIRPE